MPGQQYLALADQGERALPHPGRAAEGLDAEVVPAHAVPDDHVERGRRGAFLDEASHVEPLGVGPAVDDLVDRALIAVEGEDHRRVAAEEVDEGRLVHAVGMGRRLEQGHQVHDVDHAHPHLRHVLAEQPRRCHDLQGWNISSRRQHDVRLAPLVVARPGPDRRAGHTMPDGSFHVEPLELRLLVDDDQVDVVAASEAVIGH